MHLYISLSVKIIFYHGKSRVLEAVSNFRGPIIDSILWYSTREVAFIFIRLTGGAHHAHAGRGRRVRFPRSHPMSDASRRFGLPSLTLIHTYADSSSIHHLQAPNNSTHRE